MSQHCLCGQRHKKPLSQRTHRCQACGLTGGRDAVAAVLASCVDFTDPDNPSTAAVDYQLAVRLLADEDTWLTVEQTLGGQARPWASTDTPNPDPAAPACAPDHGTS